MEAPKQAKENNRNYTHLCHALQMVRKVALHSLGTFEIKSPNNVKFDEWPSADLVKKLLFIYRAVFEDNIIVQRIEVSESLSVRYIIKTKCVKNPRIFECCLKDKERMCDFHYFSLDNSLESFLEEMVMMSYTKPKILTEYELEAYKRGIVGLLIKSVCDDSGVIPQQK